MQQMEAGSIDLTVTSPPYDNLRTYEGSLEWNEEIWKQVLEQLYRVTKQGGVVVWVVGDATIKGSETGTSFKQALYAKEIGFNLHDTMIYNRSAMPHNAKRYNQDFEYMFVCSKGAIATFRPLMVRSKYAGVGTSPTTTNKDGTKTSRGRRIIKDFKVKSNIWSFSTGGADKGHPATFPLPLATDHIRSWSNEGDTVLDPFMGSGTTGIACKDLNRNFIGIEKVEKYFQLASDRIHSHNTGEDRGAA